MKPLIAELKRKARKLRHDIVCMIGPGRPGHLGGSCSVADAVAALYFHKMKHDPKNPGWEDRDRFLLSKGHGALAQYAALAECGYFSRSHLKTLKNLGSMLQGHPDMARTPGVEANTGSLGQGLSIACGMALGARVDGREYRVYCVLGDGENAEGQVWEAAMAAAYYRLDKLVGILDMNGLQATGPIRDLMDTSPLPEKWRAAGWHVIEIDGHDMQQIVEALNKADTVRDRPVLIAARTVKGKGVAFAEHNPAFHNGVMTQMQYEEACKALADSEDG
ncbi:MAG: transketolase [Nitrospiraceae bacterium]|nr:transketolase [Nitrospiraceae bacterium]